MSHILHLIPYPMSVRLYLRQARHCDRCLSYMLSSCPYQALHLLCNQGLPLMRCIRLRWCPYAGRVLCLLMDLHCCDSSCMIRSSLQGEVYASRLSVHRCDTLYNPLLPRPIPVMSRLRPDRLYDRCRSYMLTNCPCLSLHLLYNQGQMPMRCIRLRCRLHAQQA